MTIRFSTFLCLFCLSASDLSLAEQSPYEIAGQLDHGYLLIRILASSSEKIARFEFTSYGTGYVVKIRPETCESAGSNARICLVILPSGRYFWSKYESEYRIGLEHSTLQDPAIRREAPSSASDTFEIIAGAINYIGDWEMRIRTEDFTAHRRWSVEISQNKKTLERLFEHFPEYANQYEIYLSMMGKKVVSLQEFLRIVAEHSD